MPRLRWLVGVSGLFLGGSLVQAQISPGTPYSSAVQYFNQHWTIQEGENEYEIAQSVMPIGVYLPFADRLEVRVATSYVRFMSTQGGHTETVSGLADTKVQIGYALNAQRNFVVNSVFSLPTGFSKLDDKQQDVVTDFISPDLSVRENRLGEGLNAGGTISYVKDTSPEGLFGISAGFLHRGAFATSLINTNGSVNLQPGKEISATMAYSHTTPSSFLQISPSFTFYTDEFLNSSRTLRLGGKFQFQTLATKFFSQRKGLATFALQNVVRGQTQTYDDKATAYRVINPNTFTVLSSVDYQIIKQLRGTASLVGRFIRTQSTSLGDAEVIGNGRSNVFEEGVTLTYTVSPMASISIGQRWIKGQGTNREQEVRNIQGFEGFGRLSIRF